MEGGGERESHYLVTDRQRAGGKEEVVISKPQLSLPLAPSSMPAALLTCLCACLRETGTRGGGGGDVESVTLLPSFRL